MLVVKLVRYSFPDDPDWVIIEESVPLGTIYKVLGVAKDITITNENLNKSKVVDCYIVLRDGDYMPGYMPADLLEEFVLVEQWQKNTYIN